MKLVLAIDIGGSKMLSGIVNSSGEVIGEKKCPILKPDRELILKEVISVCETFIGKYDISGISVSIPGLVDAKNGVWLEAVFSKVKDFPLGDILTSRFRMPVYLENDANNSAVGEKFFGHARDYNDFIWLTVSNGCGAGIFLGGKLFTGPGGNAGELGHIHVTDENLPCPCGNYGCLEAAAAGPGISSRYKQLTGESISAKEIADKARAGNETAIGVFRKTGAYIGKAVAAAVNVINVPLVVIGGGISGSYDLFKDDLEKTVQEQIYRTANRSLLIKKTKLGYYASLIGAAANAFDKEA